MGVNRFETISLCNEIISLTEEDFECALEMRSFDTFENDLRLYVYVSNDLMEDLIYLEEYELCAKLKKVLNKMESSLDR